MQYADHFGSSSHQVLGIFKDQGLFGLGEAYIEGRFEVGDLSNFLYNIITSEIASKKRLRTKMVAYAFKEKFFNSQIGKKAFEVGERHYDLGNDLFSRMLDGTTMSYTSACWDNARNLDEAQVAKLRLSCEKLKLQPGMRVLDIGCGWGNWAEYAAKNYGISVVGLTISKEQAILARERCAGLPVEIVLEDYKNFRGTFDRVVSIEMIEAVGKKNLPGFYSMIERCLKPGGLFFLQVISTESFSPYSLPVVDQYVVWLLKHIFPNGYLPKMSELTNPARDRFTIEEMYNAPEDYEKTLHAWDLNFERNWPELRGQYGERFRRMWKYYLNGCEAMFRARYSGLYRIVYRKR